MNGKLNAGELVKTGIILFLITALSAALLAVVNGFTAPMIAKNKETKTQDAMRAVLPAADSFEKLEITPEIAALSDKDEITEVYKAKDSGGADCGVCVITNTSGYDVGIVTVTGVDADMKVAGVEITAMKETPGLGAKAADSSFRGQYSGKAGEVAVSKTGADDTHIQAISGATKTSNGVTRGVNLALKAAETVMEGGSK